MTAIYKNERQYNFPLEENKVISSTKVISLFIIYDLYNRLRQTTLCFSNNERFNVVLNQY